MVHRHHPYAIKYFKHFILIKLSKISKKYKKKRKRKSWGESLFFSDGGTKRTDSGMVIRLVVTHIFLKEPTLLTAPPHLYSSPVFRGWWGTESPWEQPPRKRTQGALPVLHVSGSEDRLGTLDHPVSVVILGWNHTDCKNHLQELLLSLFHDMVFNKLEHYVFPSLLFRPSSHGSRKAVANEKVQVGSMFDDLWMFRNMFYVNVQVLNSLGYELSLLWK